MRQLLQFGNTLINSQNKLVLTQLRQGMLPLQFQNRQNVRLYCDKIERPSEMNKDKTKYDFKKKAVGPISWFNLGVSGVLIGVMMGCYYYAR